MDREGRAGIGEKVTATRTAVHVSMFALSFSAVPPRLIVVLDAESKRERELV